MSKYKLLNGDKTIFEGRKFDCQTAKQALENYGVSASELEIQEPITNLFKLPKDIELQVYKYVLEQEYGGRDYSGYVQDVIIGELEGINDYDLVEMFICHCEEWDDDDGGGLFEVVRDLLNTFKLETALREA